MEYIIKPATQDSVAPSNNSCFHTMAFKNLFKKQKQSDF